MSKTTIRFLAASALALGAVCLGHAQASAFSFAPTFLLAQSGGSSGGSSIGGGTGSAGGDAGAGDASKSSGANPSGASPSRSDSRSMGVPAQCANITSAAERQACIDRASRPADKK